MKTSRINGFGSYGVYIDDIDMDHMTEDLWNEIGQLSLKELVVIFRNININKVQYLDWINKWGIQQSHFHLIFAKKFNKDLNFPPEIIQWVKSLEYKQEKLSDGRHLVRVYGMKDEQGNALGYFDSGDVGWHSNEGSSLVFAPVVSLLGWEQMSESTTGFIQTVDIFNNFSETFKSELREMVLVHKHSPGNVNRDELTDAVLNTSVQLNFCPIDGAETPLTCFSPGGHEGLHYPINTRHHIKDMSKKDSDNIIKMLDELMYDPNKMFDHYWSDKRDLIIFDNSITVHRRLGGKVERKAYRHQFDVSPLSTQPWSPWRNNVTYHDQYKKEISFLVEAGSDDMKSRFKLPN